MRPKIHKIPIIIYLVGNTDEVYCNYLYGRNVAKTGKFCAGGTVDACQVEHFFQD